MKKASFVAFGLVVLALASCTKKESVTTNETADSAAIGKPTEKVADSAKSAIPTGDNSQTSVDWAGTYEATLPCADCSGIKTTLVLDKAGTFKLEEEYLEKNHKSHDEGKFVWINNGGAIELQGKEAKYKYKVGENQLFQLNMDGTPITTTLKDHYVFKKK